MDRQTKSQLRAVGRLHSLLTAAKLDYWIFGGWAVDLYAGRVTRNHHDIDVVVHMAQLERVESLLTAAGWSRRADADADGYHVLIRKGIRVELAYASPDLDGASDWPLEALSNDVGGVGGVEARVIALKALIADKSEDYGDPTAWAKDRADLAVLHRLQRKTQS